MCNTSAISLVILCLSLDFAYTVHIKHLRAHDFHAGTDWDYLIFTQHWPTTVCKDWTHKKPNHSCSYPKNHNTWTIHGVWPTKIGSRGPENCNSTWLFDPEQVKPIENELEETWINVEKGTGLYNLWAHEWTKHGTCAAAIEPFNNEFKYFSKGLELIKQYPMHKILGGANIFPSDTKPVTLEEIERAIISTTGKQPMIRCKYEDHIQYLFELRICFDKNLNLIDCSDNSFHNGDTFITNCNVNTDIIYPDQHQNAKGLIQLYKFINWLQWFTL